jgi:rhodanese-related sulfurtransferase
MNRTISPGGLKPLVDEQSVMLLDVRRKHDFDADSATLPNAEWMNPEQLAEWSQAVPRDREVVVYCVRGGAVSTSVVDALQAQDGRARFIEGGIESWKQAGGTTVGK